MVIFIFFISSAISQEESKEYNYSTIVESYGYANKQINQEKNEIREHAYNNAKRNLLEKTMVHIKSYSKVENFKLEYDLIQSESEGFLRILEKKDIGFIENNRYKVWIKAEVIYNFSGEEISQKTKQTNVGPLSVKVWTEKEKYILNEKVKMFLIPNKDCYIKVIYNDAEKNLLQIFPNQHIKDNFFMANKLYTIPDDKGSYEFTVSSPFGEEKITVFASTSKLGQSDVDYHGSDFYKYSGNEKEYSLKTRGVKITNKEIPVEFFHESIKILIEEK